MLFINIKKGVPSAKVVKRKRMTLSFEEEDEVKCDLGRLFTRVDNILGISNVEDPMENLDYKPEDPLMEAIDSTIMEPWTIKDKPSKMVKTIFSAPLSNILEENKTITHQFHSYSVVNCLNFIITGKSSLNEE